MRAMAATLVIQSTQGAALLAAIAVASGALATNQDSATLDANGGRTTLSVESPRPVAKAVQTLIARYEQAITYEDPRFAFEDDLEDVTARVRKDLHLYAPGKAPKVIVPRGGKLTVSSSTDLASILDEVVRIQASSARGGRFRLEQTGDVFHVVPAEVRDRSGDWAAQTSVLDTAISLPTQERSGYKTIEAICSAVSAAAHIKVSVGTTGLEGGLVNEAGPPRYRLGADNEVARSVLMRAL